MDFITKLKEILKAQLKETLGENFDEAKLDTLVDEQIATIYNEDINGLKSKNSELLGKLTEVKKKSEAGGIDKEEYQRLKEEAEQRKVEQEEEEEKRAREQKNIEFLIEREKNKLLKSQEKWDQERKDYEAKMSEITGKYHNKLIDLALTKELKNVHVGDKFIKFVKSSFLSKAGVELTDDGKETVIINDNGASLPISDYVKTWAEEDEAKSVIVPPANVGGGGQGSAGGSVSRRQQLISQLSEAEKARDSVKMIAIQQELEKMG